MQQRKLTQRLNRYTNSPGYRKIHRRDPFAPASLEAPMQAERGVQSQNYSASKSGLRAPLQPP